MQFAEPSPRSLLSDAAPEAWPRRPRVGRFTYNCANRKRTMRKLSTVLVLLCSGAAGLWAQNSAQSKPSGTVQVLYAGSLGAVLEKSVGPAFEKASGFTYQGEGQGSLGAAKMISDGLRSPDVFISADAAVNDKILMAPAKKLTEWYVTFASSAMVLGYNPNSKFKSLFEQVKV